MNLEAFKIQNQTTGKPPLPDPESQKLVFEYRLALVDVSGTGRKAPVHISGSTEIPMALDPDFAHLSTRSCHLLAEHVVLESFKGMTSRFFHKMLVEDRQKRAAELVAADEERERAMQKMAPAEKAACDAKSGSLHVRTNLPLAMPTRSGPDSKDNEPEVTPTMATALEAKPDANAGLLKGSLMRKAA